MVASCDCLFRFVGGTLSMPLDIACGLDGDEWRSRCGVCAAPDDAYGPAEVDRVCVEDAEQLCPLFGRQCFGVWAVVLCVVRCRAGCSPAKPSWSRSCFHATGQYATPYTSGPRTGPRPASSTPRMYGPGAVGVGEWCEYESAMSAAARGVEIPGRCVLSPTRSFPSSE